MKKSLRYFFLVLAPILISTSCANAQTPAHNQAASAAVPASQQGARAYAVIEASFDWPNFVGDPFDYVSHDVRVTIKMPNGKTVSLPAFFDGGTTWRVRHTPNKPGVYQVVGIYDNGQKMKLRAQPQRWSVGQTAKVSSDWVRVDKRNPRRFSLSNGTRFYPFGANVAWINSNQYPYETKFSLLQKAGLNWARVWMDEWSGKDLVWSPSEKMPIGQINLKAARFWDDIMASAARHDIHVQMTIQYHGAYSLKVNSNWKDNPYNSDNPGGFLKSPDEFFTNERARELTKRKLRYIVARYGYSPNVMGWELWNEVQFSAAGQDKKWDEIAAWHREMADFMRVQDVYHHLITTSSEVPPSVFAAVDYYQYHSYPIYQIPVLSQPHFVGAEWPVKPWFVGEFGPDHSKDRPDEWTLHSGLWAGIMSDAGGAAQYWEGDQVEVKNWYFHFAAISALLKQSQFMLHDTQSATGPVSVVVNSPERADLKLTFNGGWGAVKQHDFDFSNPDDASAFGQLPSYFQGESHRDLNPAPLQIKLNLPRPGVLQLRLAQVSKAGANLRVTSDGKAIDYPFPATENDTTLDRTLSIPVKAGPQTVTLENTGQDWIVLAYLSVPDATSALAGNVRANHNWMMGWFYQRDNIEISQPQGTASGTALVKNLDAGNYRVTWWDTVAGKPLQTETVRADAKGLKLQIPAVTRDIAMWAQKMK